MFTRVVVYGGLVLSLVVAAGHSRAATIAFDVLRQSDWEPYLVLQPTPKDYGDWSLKIFDSGGTLQAESRVGYGYSRGIISFPSFEAVRSSTYRVEYKPSGSTDVSVYLLALDAPTWSSSMLQASRPSVASKIQVGTPATITWPVYPGSGKPYVDILTSTSPIKQLYHKSVDFTLGTLVTDPLPIGRGEVEVDYSRPMEGAATQLELLSGPETDLVAPAEVKFLSWQSTGFTVVPEPGSVCVIAAISLAGLLRRR